MREGQQPRRGARVIAPFRNEKLIGVVTALCADAPADFEARSIEAVLDEEPLLSDHLLDLAVWISQYYLAPLGEVLRGMLPLMAEVRRTVYYRITDLGRDVLAVSLDGDSGNGWTQKEIRKRRGKLSQEEQDLEHRVLTRLASGQSLHAAHRHSRHASCPCLHAAQKMDCPGDLGHGAGCTPYRALCGARP